MSNQKSSFTKVFKFLQPKLGYGRKIQNNAVIWSQMFISLKFKWSIKSKQFFDDSFKAHQPKWGFGRRSQNYAVIWSQNLISAQSKLHMTTFGWIGFGYNWLNKV